MNFRGFNKVEQDAVQLPVKKIFNKYKKMTNIMRIKYVITNNRIVKKVEKSIKKFLKMGSIKCLMREISNNVWQHRPYVS